MKRLIPIVLALMSFGAIPAFASSPPVVVQVAQEEPAVVIEDSDPAAEDVAWTFRFLVPTLMAITLILTVGVVVWYQRGFSRRYRVRE